MTLAFKADIACVPFAVCGAIAPFVLREAVIREALIAAAVIVANFGMVVWQTWGQVGLATQKGRSQRPSGGSVETRIFHGKKCTVRSSGFRLVIPEKYNIFNEK